LPETQARATVHFVTFAHLDSLLEIFGNRYPITFFEKERFFEKDASDLWIFRWPNRVFPIFSDPETDLIERSGAITFAESFPRKADRKLKKLRKESAANYEVSRRMQLEQEWFTPLQGLEGCRRRWSPEINLLHYWFGRVELEPIVVSYADVKPHDMSLSILAKTRAGTE